MRRTPAHHRRLGRLIASAAIAAAIGGSAPVPAAALDWGDEVRLATRLPYGSMVVATGRDSAAVAWFGSSPAGFGVQMRRTSDGGRTWTKPSRIAGRDGAGFVLAGSGRALDLVWNELRYCPSVLGRASWRVIYRRSLDAGATWSNPAPLTPRCANFTDQTVARAADGQVTVAHTELSGRVLTRTSLNGGRSFGKPVLAGRSAHCAGDAGGGRDDDDPCIGLPALAIGKEVTYLAHEGTANRGASLEVRRSTDRGASWSTPTTMALVEGKFSIVAAGRSAVVGYTDWAGQAAKYRRTLDAGQHWEPEQPIQIGALVDPPAVGRPSDRRYAPISLGPPFTAELRFSYGNRCSWQRSKAALPATRRCGRSRARTSERRGRLRRA